MKKVICILEDNYVFSYGFKLNDIYCYYKQNSDNIFVIKNNIHCGFNIERFNEQFIDIRKIKLQILNKI